MRILKDLKNDLLKRQEISIIVEAEKNPSFEEIKKRVCEKFRKSEDVVDVYNIKGSFGSHEFKVDAYIYDSKEVLGKAGFVKKKKEQIDEKPVEKPTEVPVEERVEEEIKAVKEEKQGEEDKDP